MKIVIEIDEELYKNVIEDTRNGYLGSDVWKAVAKGTPYEERPQGEWVFRNGVTCVGYYKCSKCGEVERAEKNFCPNCGARMKGGKE